MLMCDMSIRCVRVSMLMCDMSMKMCESEYVDV